jgi:hypothetical protein
MPLRVSPPPHGSEYPVPLSLYEAEFRELGLMHGFRGKHPVWQAAVEDGDPDALRLVANALEPLEDDEIGVGD